MNWIGLDIGGANLKLAHGAKHFKSVEFPLWKAPGQLAAELQKLASPILDEFPESIPPKIAVTMTGEIADCFESKSDGVAHIVGAAQEAFPNAKILVYQTNGQFCDPQDAVACWSQVAASNWHAFARVAARLLPDQTGIVIDVGSTTTDIIPVLKGKVAGESKTDFDRLSNHWLLYTGILRTPICSLIDSVTFDNKTVAIANELFATTLDAHVYLENIKQSESGASTADGRPATIRDSVKRLARMYCSDQEEIGVPWIRALAEATEQSQTTCIRNSLDAIIKSVPDCASAMLVAGRGDWLAKKAIKSLGLFPHLLELRKLESPAASACAPAYAVATLAGESDL